MFAKFDNEIAGNDVKFGFKYSTQIMTAKPMTPAMEELLDDVNRILGKNYNRMLVNEYVDGDDCVGKHSDGQKELDLSQGVAAISWGGVRNFRIRNKKDNSIVANIPTTPYSLMLMDGEFQTEFTHEIPKKKMALTRVSMTFRRHNERD